MLHMTTVHLKREKIKTLLVPVCQDKPIHKSPPLVALIEQALKLKEFKGKKDQEVVLYNPQGIAAERVMLRGLGKAEALDAEALRQMVGKALKRCIQMDVSRLWVAVPEAKAVGLAVPALLKALLEAAYLGNHVFNRYRQEKELKRLARIELVVDGPTQREFALPAGRGRMVCQGTLKAREWVSTPANDKLPGQLAKAFTADALKGSGVTVRILDESQLKRQRFNALLAVAAGSSHPPCPGGDRSDAPPKARQTVVLVGKGITFDTGGVNLKPSAGLDTMKADMSGAAAVAGAMLALSRLKPDQRVVGITPNRGHDLRISHPARRHCHQLCRQDGGDRQHRRRRSPDPDRRHGLRRQEYAPKTMIDVATLTGACVMALGEKIAGVFATDETLRADFWRPPAAPTSAAGPCRCRRTTRTGQKRFADLNNMPSSRDGGAITAALFLSAFVGNTPWAHIDIAGPAYQKKESAYCGAGGTGFGVRLLTDWLMHRN